MSRQLPAKAIDLLNGRHEAAQIAEKCSLAYWLHRRCNDTALMMVEQIHSDFAAMADALGYDIIERQPATSEAQE